MRHHPKSSPTATRCGRRKSHPKAKAFRPGRGRRSQGTTDRRPPPKSFSQLRYAVSAIGDTTGINLVGMKDIAWLGTQIESLPLLGPMSPPLELGFLSVRKLVRKSHHHSVGRVYSPRFGTIEYESGVSRDAVFAAHAEPAITHMISQPLALSWPNAAGVLMPYFPDYALMRAGKLVIMDAHHDEVPASAEQMLRWQDRSTAFRRCGVGYEVWFKSDVAAEPRLSNIRLLIASAVHRVMAEEIQAVLRLALCHPSGISATAIVQELGLAASDVHRIFAMVYHGHLCVADSDGCIDADALLMATNT